MLDKIMTFMAPHHCCGCDKIGTLLCDDCKYNITSEPYLACISCRRAVGATGVCVNCVVPYEQAWVVGERRGVLQRLIGLYKFERAREGYQPLADLVLSTLPVLPPNVVIVPVPTTSNHIRERGYDHALLIARRVAKRRSLPLESLLYRKTKTKQRQASARQREAQARVAFGVRERLDPDKIYLLFDDVVTTGATIKYAAKALRTAGARHVWVVAIARQTLD